MRASTPTKLSLWRFGELMGIHPYHFAGCIINGVTSPTCDLAWRQHQWQNVDAIGRETVATAIAEAEAQLEQLVGYRLMPDWEVDERHEADHPSKPELVFVNQTNKRGFWRSVVTDWGQFISGGTREATVIGLSAAIAYTGTYSEVATVTAPLPAGDAADSAECEVRVFYPGKGGAPAWEIRPVTVDITAGTATITFNRAQCLLESIQEDLTGPEDPAELTVDGNFLTEVDVYRIWNHPGTQATLMWREAGAELRVNTGEFTVQTGVLQSPDQRLGIVSFMPANWDEDTWQFIQQSPAVNRGADVVRLWYFGGFEDKRGNPCCYGTLAPYWERVVAHLAASKLNRNPCDCNPHLFEHYREDLTFEQGGEQFSRYGVSRWHAERIYAAFGSATRGAMEAYAAAVAAPGVRLGSKLSGASAAVG